MFFVTFLAGCKMKDIKQYFVSDVLQFTFNHAKVCKLF